MKYLIVFSIVAIAWGTITEMQLRTASKRESHLRSAYYACINNHAYTRNLLGQCLDDYQEMRGWK